jgi:hypothetical protein
LRGNTPTVPEPAARNIEAIAALKDTHIHTISAAIDRQLSETDATTGSSAPRLP